MFTYGIGYGANLGARFTNFALTTSLLRLAVNVDASSRLYANPPIGAANRPFVNGALRVRTTLEPDALLATLLRIESLLGRERREKWGNRTCDLDILWYSGGAYESRDVKIPHPELLHRNFALAPLLEVLPDIVGETPDGRSYREHLHTLHGELHVASVELSKEDELADAVQKKCAWDTRAKLTELQAVDFDVWSLPNRLEAFEAGRDLALRAGHSVMAATLIETPNGVTTARLLIRMKRPDETPRAT